MFRLRNSPLGSSLLVPGHTHRMSSIPFKRFLGKEGSFKRSHPCPHHRTLNLLVDVASSKLA